MDGAAVLRRARRRAGLSQAALAARAGTSQATVSAYEGRTKVPSVDTLDRLLAAVGARLSVRPAPASVVVPDQAQLAEAGRILADVIGLAEALPARHCEELGFPRLPG